MSDFKQVSIGRERAIKLAETKWWEECTDREIAEFQISTQELCVPFARFHEAVEKCLGRPVFTHEFSSVGMELLSKEIGGEIPPPTLEDILSILPPEKMAILTKEPSRWQYTKTMSLGTTGTTNLMKSMTKTSLITKNAASFQLT